MAATGSPRARAASAMAAAMVDHQPHPDHRGVPAGGAQRAEMRARGGLLVDDETAAGRSASAKALISSAREGVAADREALADCDVLEIFHGRCPGCAARRASTGSSA